MNFKTYKRRDLLIVEIDENSIVVACDSCGAVGEKKFDVVQTTPFNVGRFTTRVAVMEVMSANAKLISVSNGVCNEMGDTGKKIIEGIKIELEKLDFDIKALTGSTEENFITSMTAVGITTIGVVATSKLKFNAVKPGDKVILLGRAMYGEEVLNNFDKLVTYEDVQMLLNLDDVIEIVPCGSKGILYECKQLARLNELEFKNRDLNNLEKSCGPASCIVVAVKKDFDLNQITSTIEKIEIGTFENN